jgi:2-iminoacetate synthase
MFSEELKKYDFDRVMASVPEIRDEDVERVLLKSGRKSPEDFLVLIAPAAGKYLGEMALKSREITLRRFGKALQLFAPLYLSNECKNICTYCGFSMDNKLPRRTLTPSEILREADAVKALGFDHVLLVSGEENHRVHTTYFLEAVRLLREKFSQISLEVQPLEQPEYAELVKEGMFGVLVYQETYNKKVYGHFHPKGKKSNFDFRVNTPDRIGMAGAKKTGLGVLLGLSDWRTDSYFAALHLQYLEKKYWQTRYSISLPRLRPIDTESGRVDSVGGGFISDRELLQLIFAWRIFNEELEISISTRESQMMRDFLIGMGPTSFSAGSKTNPGGYAVEPETLEQFSIDDQRSPEEFAQRIIEKGFDPVWKDWHPTAEHHLYPV